MSVAFEAALSSSSRLVEAALALALALVALFVWGVVLPLQVVLALT
jgi:hypothetical protein